MAEIVFEVTQEADGGLAAECLTESIFTQADSWDELHGNAKEAVAAYFFDHPQPPTSIRLHLVRDEVLANS
jgi:predicted RNase H-like HicB family nuclease